GQRGAQDRVFLERGERATLRRGDDEVADAERKVGVVGDLDVGDSGAGVASWLMRGHADLILPAGQLHAPEQPQPGLLYSSAHRVVERECESAPLDRAHRAPTIDGLV